MSTRLVKCLVVVLIVASIGTSCRDGSSSRNAAVADAETMQGVLPALEASQSLSRPAPEPAEADGGGFAVAETVGTWNVGDLPPTPADMYALYDTGSGYARFPPAGGFINDLYGSEGLLAFIELRPVSDGWGEYQASLWVYPTLSTAVWRGLEQYRLNGDSWDNLIPDPDGNIFEDLKSYYFDGRVEDRSLVWSRNWVDAAGSQIYDTSYFDMPKDFSDPAYDFPDPFVPPAMVAAPLTDDSSYASQTEGSVVFPVRWSGRTAKRTEFYNQTPDGGSGVLKYTKSFEETTSSNLLWRSEGTVVNVAFEDAGGSTMAQSKTVTDYSVRGVWSYRSTETVATESKRLGSGRTKFSSQTMTYYDDSKQPSTIVDLDLTETAADSSEYEGTLVFTLRGRVRDSYTATLDAQNGLQISSSGSTLTASFYVNRVTHLTDSPDDPPEIDIEFSNGSGFRGELSAGRLRGTYTDSRGRQRDLSVTRSSIIFDGELLDQGSPR